MEVSVGFADGDKDYTKDYIQGETLLGRIFVPREGVELDNGIDGIRVRYEKHPWIERFELDGIKAAKPRRTGYGTKTAKSFVKSLNTIYAQAFEEYYSLAKDGEEVAYCDWERYFGKVTETFEAKAEAPQFRKMAKKFIGFAENMWREGDPQVYRLAMEVVVPGIRSGRNLGQLFEEVITEEFSEYLKSH